MKKIAQNNDQPNPINLENQSLCSNNVYRSDVRIILHIQINKSKHHIKMND